MSLKKDEMNLLEMTAIHVREFEKDENGKVVVLVPRFNKKWLMKLFVPKSKTDNIKVKLDEFGSAAWLKIDGNKKTGEIAEELLKEFGEKIQPAEIKLATFFAQLYDNKLISFIELNQKDNNNG